MQAFIINPRDKGNMKTPFMRKIGLMIIMLLTAMGVALAQEEQPEKKEKMFREVQEFKMKFLAQEMDLSEVQKKKFFELYEEMSQSKRNCYQEAIKMDRQIKHDKNATEEDYQKVTEAFNKANTEWAETEKQYNDKFAEFLSSKQIYQMREAEKTYKERVSEMRHNRKKDHHKKEDEKK